MCSSVITNSFLINFPRVFLLHALLRWWIECRFFGFVVRRSHRDKKGERICSYKVQNLGRIKIRISWLAVLPQFFNVFVLLFGSMLNLMHCSYSWERSMFGKRVKHLIGPIVRLISYNGWCLLSPKKNSEDSIYKYIESCCELGGIKNIRFLTHVIAEISASFLVGINKHLLWEWDQW